MLTPGDRREISGLLGRGSLNACQKSRGNWVTVKFIRIPSPAKKLQRATERKERLLSGWSLSDFRFLCSGAGIDGLFLYKVEIDSKPDESTSLHVLHQFREMISFSTYLGIERISSSKFLEFSLLSSIERFPRTLHFFQDFQSNDSKFLEFLEFSLERF